MNSSSIYGESSSANDVHDQVKLPLPTLPNPHGWQRCSNSVTNPGKIHLVYCFSILKVNETHMEFLSASEFLGEISDDLFDYEDDVLHNTFNMLRMFIAIYGTSSGPTLLVSSYR
ncbi:hypothetical protein HanPI659440_Chr15g0591191 [Helianthus annuus]|nr:hypothetical protein HanPI659440_Chr15g0591191 [Helianthus annuus]